MTSVPYPSFVNQPPVENGRLALAAVGKCRIYPETCSPDNTEEYRAIVSICVQQGLVNTDIANDEDRKNAKKLKKKYMKQGVAMANKYLMETLQLDVSVVDVQVVVTAKDLVDSRGCLAACLLDAGSHAIIVNGMELQAMDVAKIPRERLVAHFDSSLLSMTEDLVRAVAEAAPLASVMSMEMPSSEAPSLDGATEVLNLVSPQQQEELDIQVILQFSSEACTQVGDEDLAASIGTISKTFKDGKGGVTVSDPTANQLGLCYASCMRTDRPDGLYTTVVCTRSGEALGLVYSSKESIVAALECGRGVYYSRSRNGLWRKGDTSGHYQTLHRLDVDCDGDALRFTVTQRGDNVAAFCHLNTLTCWGEPCGLRHLEQTLKERLKSAPEGSYTKRLFEDDELLRDKLVEEAQELSEADTAQHVAEELADVLYFSMVRAAKAGVSMDAAVAELDKRARKVTRRKGDSKAERIAAGNEILNKNK